MAVSAHAVGWPIPRGGVAVHLQMRYVVIFRTFGGKVKTSSRVESLAALSHYDLILCDVTPRQLLRIAGQRLSDSYKRRLETFPLRSRRFQSRLRTERHPSRGKLPSACARRPCTWAGALRRLLHRNSGAKWAARGFARLFCSLSRVCLIPRAPPRPNTRRGRIATFPTGRRWTC